MYIPKKISEKLIIKNSYLKVSEKVYVDNLNRESSFLITSHNREETIGTFILPITNKGEVIYLKEYRYGPEKYVINFPVGILDDGISEIDNCKKELLQETGYISDNFQYLTESIIENYFEGLIKYYIAFNCKKKELQNLENGENIYVYKSSIIEFENMIKNNEVLSSKTCYCFLLARVKGLI